MIKSNVLLKALLCCGMLLGIHQESKAQNLGFEWVQKLDTASFSRGISADKANKVYIAGLVNGTPRLLKYDEGGNVLWSRQVAYNTTTGGVAEISSVQADRFGNVYVTGHFNNSIVLNNHNDTITANGTLATSLNGYIAKYDTAGNFKWAKVLGKGARQAYATDITIDSRGHLAILGRYIGKGDFNPHPVDSFMLTNGSTNNSLHNIYITKLDSTGTFIWAKQFQGSSGVSTGFSIEADRWDNLIASGSFRGTMDFDPGIYIVSRTVASGVDGFVVKLDADGQFNWVRQIAGQATTSSSAREVYDIALDSAGAVYATGYFSNSVIFDQNQPMIPAVSSFDAMIFKCDSAGAMVWNVIYAGNASDIGRSITLDNRMNIITTGTFSDSVDFDPGAGTYYLKTRNNPNNFYTDIYYAKLTNSGDFIWAKSMGGKHLDQADGIVLDGANNLYTVGYFQSDTCDFDPDPLTSHLVNLIPPPFPMLPQLPNNEIFIHKMSCSDTSSSILDTVVCSELLFDNQVHTSNGTYVHILKGATGCDSTVTIRLTIEDVGAMITVNGFELGTTLPYTTYQWIKDGVLIPGATGATYTVTANGDYRVIVGTELGCKDTAAVYTVNNVTSVPEYDQITALIKVYPNPATDNIFIYSPVPVNISLSGIDGKTLLTVQRAQQLSLQHLKTGVYFLTIRDENDRIVKVEKIVKL